MQEIRLIPRTDQTSDPDTENALSEAPVPRRLLRLCAALVMIISGGWLLIESMRSDQSPDLSPTAVTPVDSSQQPHSATKAIKGIQVGERVLAENPELHQAQRTAYREPDWSQWLQLSLVMLKEDGSELNMELLRTEDWVRRHLIPLHSPFADKNSSDAPTSQNELHPKVASQNPGDVPLSPLRPVFRELVFQQVMLEAVDRELIGMAVEMDLPELAITGPALLVDMQAAPLIKAGQGRVVTATFQHTKADVIDLTIGDAVERETIGTTSNHPFWSEDRQAFVQAGSLKSGERVRTYLGDHKQVISLLARPGPQEVYNLEVHAEHVYYVGEFGALVHNSGVYNANASTDVEPRTLTQQRELARLTTEVRDELVNDFDSLFGLLARHDGVLDFVYKEPWSLRMFFGTEVEAVVARRIDDIVEADPNHILASLTWTGRGRAPQDFLDNLTTGRNGGQFGFDISGGSMSSIREHFGRPEIDAVITYDSIPGDLGYRFRDWLDQQ